MKKLIALILAMLMLLGMSTTAFAENVAGPNVTTLYTTVPESVPAYTLSIPADATVPYGQTCTNLGAITVTVDNFDYDNKSVFVEWNNTFFASATTNTEIALGLYLTEQSDGDLSSTPSHCYWFGFEAPNDTKSQNLYLCVPQCEWQSAEPGDYSATIVFTAELLGI